MLFLSRRFFIQLQICPLSLVIHIVYGATDTYIFQFGDPEKWQSESETRGNCAAQMKWRCVVWREREHAARRNTIAFCESTPAARGVLRHAFSRVTLTQEKSGAPKMYPALLSITFCYYFICDCATCRVIVRAPHATKTHFTYNSVSLSNI